MRQIDATLEELDSLVHRAERDFRLLERDVECLRQLEGLASDPPEDLPALRRLLGAAGPEIQDRLGLSPDATRDAALDAAWDLHGVVARRKHQTRGVLAEFTRMRPSAWKY